MTTVHLRSRARLSSIDFSRSSFPVISLINNRVIIIMIRIIMRINSNQRTISFLLRYTKGRKRMQNSSVCSLSYFSREKQAGREARLLKLEFCHSFFREILTVRTERETFARTLDRNKRTDATRRSSWRVSVTKMKKTRARARRLARFFLYLFNTNLCVSRINIYNFR